MTRLALLALAAALPARALAVDYATDIRPTLESRCAECHGAKKQKGGLRLDSPEAIAKGGKNGPVVVAGDAASPLYVRVSLPGGDDDRMPPEGDRLTKAQQDAILAWIKAGAAMGAVAPAPGADMAASAPTETKPATKAEAKPPETRKDLPPPPDTELDALAQGVKAPDAHVLDALKGFGVWTRALSKNGALLELDYRQIRGPVTADMLKPLGALADNILWLDFAGTGVTDRDLTHLRGLKRLRSLHLERTEVGDKGLVELGGLAELRYLNLYSTKVDDAGLKSLEKLAKLRALYLMQTPATQAGADALAKAIPGLEVTLAEDLPEPAKPDDAGGGKQKKKKK